MIRAIIGAIGNMANGKAFVLSLYMIIYLTILFIFIWSINYGFI